MSPIQQMLLGVGAVATKTYVDQIFSTFLYDGNTTAKTITNQIDNSEGGMVWLKARNASGNHGIFDTVRGATKYIRSNNNNAENNDSNTLSSFNSNGFSIGTDTSINDNNTTYCSWNFRKAPGFFTIKQYTGSGSTQSISHDLGSVPGMIIVKRTDYVASWAVYHRQANGGVDPEDYTAELNTSANFYNDTMWGDTKPTSTHFTVGDAKGETNASGGTYIAYIFAGGESTAATARSVDFDGSDDKLTISDDSDLDAGSGDYTVECFFKQTAAYTNYLSILAKSDGSLGYWLQTDSSGRLLGGEHGSTFITSTTTFARGVWNHAALVRQSGTMYLYLNGNLEGSVAGSSYSDNSSVFGIGVLEGHGRWFGGEISNVRFVKGTAVYTSSFKPSYEPLTNITNTKLLCCNNSSTTGSTVTPGTITAGSSPTASSDSPFDDPAGFVFGDAGDQNVIECGSYTTDSNEDATVHLGWEPQWVFAKRTDSTGDWRLYDSMRGLPNAQDIAANNSGSKYLEANDNAAESNSSKVGPTSTGFYADQDGANRTYIYCAIRRPDGYVGKPPELGTGVFAMDTGNGNQSIPNFDSGFPVDFSTQREFASSSNWYTGARLTGNKYVFTDTSDSEGGPADDMVWDSNLGIWANGGGTTAWQSWMWKRHAGFDVVAYKGDGVSPRNIPHSMNKAPEMMWVKSRSASENWYVYHKGHNGGSGPEHWFTSINTSGAEQDHGPAWADTVPTSTYFTVGGDTAVNKSGDNYIAMLFASVNGISKVGYYDGSNSSQTISTGFAPRFVIIKRVDTAENWFVLDTLRGWASGNDQRLRLNRDSAQNNGTDYGAPTSTGFSLTGNVGGTNTSGGKYIYYCHA